jgi:hypothetical protein
MIVRQRYRRGEELEIPRERTVSKSSRESRFPGASDPVHAQLDVYEVVIPMEMTSLGGKRISVRLGLWYAWIPARRQWELYTIAVYGVPFNEDVIPPPL